MVVIAVDVEGRTQGEERERNVGVPSDTLGCQEGGGKSRMEAENRWSESWKVLSTSNLGSNWTASTAKSQFCI